MPRKGWKQREKVNEYWNLLFVKLLRKQIFTQVIFQDFTSIWVLWQCWIQKKSQKNYWKSRKKYIRESKKDPFWGSEKKLIFWNSVVFSDKTILELNAKGHCFPALLKAPNFYRFLEKNPLNCGKKLMTWGCIRSTEWRLLVPIGNEVDAKVYISMLKEHVVNFLYLHEPFQQNKTGTCDAKNQNCFHS